MAPTTRSSTTRARADESQAAALNDAAAVTEESDVESESGSGSDDTDEGLLTEYCMAGNFDEAKRMLDLGTPAHEMALFHAVTKRHGDVAALLIQHGADIQAFPHGLSVLFWAVRRNSMACVEVLLDQGADVELTSPTITVTPLMEACIQGYEKVARMLCSYGASRTAVNEHGNNAAWFARENADSGEVNGHEHRSISAFLLRSRLWTTPLHFLEELTPRRAALLLKGGALRMHARAAAGAPSPLDLAKSLERDGRAPPGSPAAIVLDGWRDRLLALAMGTHARLGAGSAMRHLGAVRDEHGRAALLEKVLDFLAECEVLWVAGDGWDGTVAEEDPEEGIFT